MAVATIQPETTDTFATMSPYDGPSPFYFSTAKMKAESPQTALSQAASISILAEGSRPLATLLFNEVLDSIQRYNQYIPTKEVFEEILLDAFQCAATSTGSLDPTAQCSVHFLMTQDRQCFSFQAGGSSVIYKNTDNKSRHYTGANITINPQKIPPSITYPALYPRISVASLQKESHTLAGKMETEGQDFDEPLIHEFRTYPNTTVTMLSPAATDNTPYIPLGPQRTCRDVFIEIQKIHALVDPLSANNKLKRAQTQKSLEHYYGCLEAFYRPLNTIFKGFIKPDSLQWTKLRHTIGIISFYIELHVKPFYSNNPQDHQTIQTALETLEWLSSSTPPSALDVSGDALPELPPDDQDIEYVIEINPTNPSDTATTIPPKGRPDPSQRIYEGSALTILSSPVATSTPRHPARRDDSLFETAV